MLREFGSLPVIAEDLGLITPEVNSMRKECGFPGMKVLQFAFEDDWHQPFLPHNVESLSVIYTGTHDNNTTRGWWKEASPEHAEMSADTWVLKAMRKTLLQT